jgi:hypothetical protein
MHEESPMSDSANEAAEPDVRNEPERRPSGATLGLYLLLSFLFCVAMGPVFILFNWDTTFELWLGWTIAWGVVWIVFALLQVRWWARGDEKFWRPLYAWTLLAYVVLSLFFLPLLLWPRFRRWLFRVLKPADPPDWRLETSLRTLARLRDDGILTSEEFETKKADLLRA